MDTFPQTREADLLVGSQTFKSQSAALAAAIGLTVAQLDQFSDLQASFATKYAAAQEPSTRSPTVLIEKTASKKAMVDYARLLIRQIQANPAVTDTQRRALNINVPKARTRQGPPDVMPVLEVVGISGHDFDLRISDPRQPTKRGRGEDIQGVTIFQYVGEELPEDLSGFAFVANMTRMSFTVSVPSTVPVNAKVYFTAFFYNSKGESGDACAPVETYVQRGGVLKRAA